MKTLFTTRTGRFLAVAVFMISSVLLSGCGGDGDSGSGPVGDANPTGYYIGTASYTSTTRLQGIVQNNRLMMMNVAEGLIYDGTITVNGNSFSGSLNIYIDGISPVTASVSGTISQGTRITGTLSGTGVGSGTFNLNYAASNSSVANVSRVEANEFLTNTGWNSNIAGSTNPNRIIVNANGEVAGGDGTTDGNLSACLFYDTTTAAGISAVANTSLYNVTINLLYCVVEAANSSALQNGTAGVYTGFATTRNDPDTDDTLVLMVTSANGAYAVGGNFK